MMKVKIGCLTSCSWGSGVPWRVCWRPWDAHSVDFYSSQIRRYSAGSQALCLWCCSLCQQMLYLHLICKTTQRRGEEREAGPGCGRLIRWSHLLWGYIADFLWQRRCCSQSLWVQVKAHRHQKTAVGQGRDDEAPLSYVATAPLFSRRSETLTQGKARRCAGD